MIRTALTAATLTLFSVSAMAGEPGWGHGRYGHPVRSTTTTTVTSYYGGNTIGGALIGAAAGGFLGSRVGRGDGRLAAVAGGTLLGALIGGSFGQSLDRTDYAYAGRPVRHAYGPNRFYERDRSYERIVWNDPQTGERGTVQAGPITNNGGRYCREYQQTVTVGGRVQDSYGTACRQPDGAWQIVN